MIFLSWLFFPVIIAPNHTGDDFYRFDKSFKNKAEFYVQHVTGSVTYRCGVDLTDLMVAYLIYPIKHHVWQDLPNQGQFLSDSGHVRRTRGSLYKWPSYEN